MSSGTWLIVQALARQTASPPAARKLDFASQHQSKIPHVLSMSVPPGASYQASNTYVKLKRRLLNLEAPVRVQFKDEWNQGNPLYDWYQRRNSRGITAMQLRKEKNAPFFHQYIVFELSGGHYFRIDRRQLPDETTPLDCIYEHGVDAYDTIEQVTSFEDASYSRSDCLVAIRFREPLFLEIILKILWAIHWHPSTRVYTLQRYNCYFVSQTILFLSAKSDPNSYSLETDIMHSLDDDCLSGPNCTTQDQDDWVRAIHINFQEKNRLVTQGPLASVLANLLQELNTRDQGFHKMCLTHWRSCLVCTGQRASFSSSEIADTASKIRRQYGRDRLNIPDFTDHVLMRFQNSLADFCGNTLKNLCDTQAKKIATKLPEAYNKGELDQVVSEEIDAAFAFNYDLKTSWTNYVHDALQRLAKDINPIMQCALECPTWEPTLTPEVTVENIIHLRKMDNWVECVSEFFEAEYHQLETALKAEV
ncbi:Replicase polyprotein 1a [Rhizoctonia solani]|uniref:Replicase polyprotein 1a n=1 Tax=Rhizoctonia solani TaxID=456999 RepID=A0A0K6GHK2_9AGAM|nr:Replicase polyprotein 1a [Rhizoctonia solani]